MDGHIIQFYSTCYELNYSSTDKVEVHPYEKKRNVSLYSSLSVYDPASGKLVGDFSVDAEVSSEYGYLVKGKLKSGNDKNIAYTIDEKGAYEPSVPGPEITDVDAGIGEVTLAFKNAKQGSGSSAVEYKKYEVSYRKKGESGFISAPAPQKNKAHITGLEKGAEYTVRITTVAEAGDIKYLMRYTDTDVTILENELVEGWNTVNGRKMYVDGGKAVSGKTMTIGGKLYCFDDSGALCQEGYATIGGRKYYVNADGTAACGKYIESDHKNMKYVLADKNGVLTEYEIKKSGSDWELYRNGEIATLDEVIGSKSSDIFDKLGIEYYSSTSEHAYVIFDGRIYHFDSELLMELITPAKSAGKKGVMFDAASGRCYGVYKFSADKKPASGKYYLTNGTLTMEGADVKYAAGSDGSYSVKLLSTPKSVKSEAAANAVKLSWQKVNGAESYNVYLYDKDTKEYGLYKNVKDASCMISGLKKSTTYKLRVAGVIDLPGGGFEQKAADASVKTASKNLSGMVTKNGSRYYYSSGFMTKDQLVKYSGKYYGFGSDGKMIKNKTCKVGGYTYQFGKNGAAVTDKWTYKGYKVATYIGKDGKFTTYDFSEAGVKINGRSATYKDFTKYGTGIRTFRLGKLYYTIDISTLAVTCGFIDNEKFDVYDIATGKVVDTMVKGTFMGELTWGKDSDNTIWNNSTAFSTKNGTICKFSKHEIKTKTKTSSPLILCANSSSLNSVVGCNTYLAFYNNSSKTIKYINANVSVLNRVGDVVSCNIWGYNTFTLEYVGPLKFPYQ